MSRRAGHKTAVNKKMDPSARILLGHETAHNIKNGVSIQHPRLRTLCVPRCERSERLRRLSAPQKTSETVRRASSPSGFHQFSGVLNNYKMDSSARYPPRKDPQNPPASESRFPEFPPAECHSNAVLRLLLSEPPLLLHPSLSPSG